MKEPTKLEKIVLGGLLIFTVSAAVVTGGVWTYLIKKYDC